jgi:hypothetical protein
MATYVNNLRLTELATGEGSGTWGTTTNTNLELIGQALGFGTRAIANASTDNITIADGASDADRAMYLKLTGGGQACTVTILPNTTSKVWWMENATSYTLTFTCGSGANVAVLAGETKCISTDGLGSGGAVYDVLTDVNLAGTTKVDDLVVGDALTVGGTLGVTGVLTTTAATVFNGGFASNADSTLGTDKKVQFRDAAIYLNSSADGQLDIVADTEIQIAATTIDVNGTLAFDSLKGTGATTVTNILDEDNMASDSATAIATQQSIKAYVDSQVGTVDTLSEILANGNTTGSTDIAVDSAQKVQFRDAAIYINSSVDGQLDIVADTEIQIAATTIDIDGAVDIASTLQVDGAATFTTEITANGGIALGDSDIATFGAGSDATIFSDGTSGYMRGFALQNKLGDKDVLVFVDGGATSIYHNNSPKLATTATGIDVTGTVTADGGSISGNVLIGTSLSSAKLTVGTFGDTARAAQFHGDSILLDGGAASEIIIGDGNAAYMSIQTTDDATAMKIRNYSGSADLVTIERVSGNVGIGTSSSTVWNGASGTKLLVGGASNTITSLQSSSTTINQGGIFEAYSTAVTSGSAALGSINFLRENTSTTAASSYASFYTNNGGTVDEKMRIDASGNVGVGTNSPSTYGKLVVINGTLASVNTGGNQQLITVANSTITANLGVYNASLPNTASLTTVGSHPLAFGTANTERIRIDASGNVGIGNSLPLGRLTISNAAGANAPSTVTAANTYLQLGSDDYGPSNNGKFMIGFGFTDATNTNSPAYIGYEEATTSGDTYGDLTFYTRSVTTDTAPTERMRITSGGALEIGPTANKVIIKSQASFQNTTLESHIINADGTGAYGSGDLLIQPRCSNVGSNNIVFGTSGGTDTATERMRIDASGNLLVGTTAAVGKFSIEATPTGTARSVDYSATGGTVDYYIVDDVNVGSISVTTTATAYNTSSDARLKENIADAESASELIDAIQVRSFDWKADGSHQDYGMIAQELQAVAPEAVSGDADSEEMMGVDYSKLVPMLIKEIQSLRNRVAQLEGI